jgi:O-antigen/teichoic acid export membrane protein
MQVFGPQLRYQICTTGQIAIRRVKSSPIVCRLLAGAFWGIAGTLISRACGLLTSIIVARALGKTGFGEFGIIQGTLLMFGTVAGVGLGTTATKYVAENRSTDLARTGRIIALSRLLSWSISGALAILLFGLAQPMACKTLNAPHLVPQLQAGALLLLFSGINGSQTGVLSGFEAFRTIATINTSVGIAGIPLMAIAVLRYGLQGAIFALAITALANCVCNWYALRMEAARRGIVVHLRGALLELPITWQFSLPVLLVSLVLSPAVWLSSTFLTSFKTGYDALGAFSVALQWRNIIVMVPSMLGSVALPTLSNLSGTCNPRAYRKVVLLNLGMTTVVAALATAATLFSAPWIAAGYGPKFGDSIPVIRLMAVSGFMYAVNSVVGVVLSSLGRAWTGLLFVMLCSAAMVCSAYFLVPHFGAVGLALSHTIAYLLHSLWQGLFLWRALKGHVAWPIPTEQNGGKASVIAA